MMALQTFGKHCSKCTGNDLAGSFWRIKCVRLRSVSQSGMDAVELVPFWVCSQLPSGFFFLARMRSNTNCNVFRKLFSCLFYFDDQYNRNRVSGKKGHNTTQGGPENELIFNFTDWCAKARQCSFHHRPRHTTMWSNRYANDISKSFTHSRRKKESQMKSNDKREQKGRIIYSNYIRQSRAKPFGRDVCPFLMRPINNRRIE